MAKYNWKNLEKEYILSDYKSVSAFFRDKGIKNDGYVRKKTIGWTNKKRQREDKKVTKILEKVTEKEAEQEAKKIADLRQLANDLAFKVNESMQELNTHLATNKKKTRKLEYDYITNKPSKEVIEEKEEIISYTDIIDRKGLKELTSALKDLNDILNVKPNINNEKESLADVIQKAYEEKTNQDGRE